MVDPRMPGEERLNAWADALRRAGLGASRGLPDASGLDALRRRAGLTRDQIAQLEQAALRQAMRGGAALGAGLQDDALAARDRAQRLAPWCAEVQALAATLGQGGDRPADSPQIASRRREDLELAPSVERAPAKEPTSATAPESGAGAAVPSPSPAALPAAERVIAAGLRWIVFAVFLFFGLAWIADIVDEVGSLLAADEAEPQGDASPDMSADERETEAERLALVPLPFGHGDPPPAVALPSGPDLPVHVVAPSYPLLRLGITRSRAELRGTSALRVRVALRFTNRGASALTEVKGDLIARGMDGAALHTEEVTLLGISPPVQPGESFVWGVPAHMLPEGTADLVLRLERVGEVLPRDVTESPACVQGELAPELTQHLVLTHLQTLDTGPMRSDDYRVRWEGDMPLGRLVLTPIPVDPRGHAVLEEPWAMAVRNVASPWRPPLLPGEARLARAVHFLRGEVRGRVDRVCLEVTEIEALEADGR